MPYRRLPNTDQARIRALKAVVVKGDICNVYDLAVSLKALTDARNFLTKFEAAQAYYADCFERQARAGRKHQANVKTARLYISHFIQVLNLAVIRSDLLTFPTIMERLLSLYFSQICLPCTVITGTSSPLNLRDFTSLASHVSFFP